MYLGSARKKVHTLGINAITASADGQRLLSSALDGSLALWDASMLFAHIAHVRHSVQRESLETAEAAAPDTAGDAERDWPLSLVEAKLFQKNAKAGHSADLQVWKDADGTDGKPSISVQDASFGMCPWVACALLVRLLGTDLTFLPSCLCSTLCDSSAPRQGRLCSHGDPRRGVSALCQYRFFFQEFWAPADTLSSCL